MKLNYKQILISVLIGFIVGTLINFNDEPDTTIQTNTTKEVVETKDTTEVIQTDDDVTVEDVVINLKPKAISPLPTAEVGTVNVDISKVEIKRYTGVDTLDNGRVEFEIYADRLLARKFTLYCKEKTITTTTTITKWDSKSKLYLGGGVDINPLTQSPQSYSAGLLYTFKQKGAVSLNTNYNLNSPSRFSVGVKLWVPLL